MIFFIPILIIFSGIFLFDIQGENNLVHTPQIAWLIFSAGTIFSFLITKKSKLAGCVFFIIFLSFLRTILILKVPKVALFESMLISFSVFAIYLSARFLQLKENLLKYFLIPACLNIGLVFFQKILPQIFAGKNEAICGFLGNPGLTATFLGLTTPIFLRYFKHGLVFLLLALILCKGIVGLLIFTICIILNYRKNIKIWHALTFMALLTFGYLLKQDSGALHLRLSMMAGTLDGIFHHPFLGWGVSSFVYIMAQIPKEESIYFGMPFNSERYIMNHPHNEFLFGWWNFGLLFFIFSIFYVIKIFKGFEDSKVMPFTILLGSLIIMTFYFFVPVTLFLTALTLGVYENMEGEKNGKSGIENTEI